MTRLLKTVGMVWLALAAAAPGLARAATPVARLEPASDAFVSGALDSAPGGGARTDTTWHGGYYLFEGDYHAWPSPDKWDVAWTFDHGSGPFPPVPQGVVAYGEGWKSVDLTANEAAYFRVIDSTLDLGPGVPAPILSGLRSLWVGVDRLQAEALCWAGGAGYGNEWRQRAVSDPLGYNGSGSVNLSFRYFLDIEHCYDGFQVYLRREDGSELLLNPYPPGTCPDNANYAAGATGVIGSYGAPAYFSRSISAAEIGAGPQVIWIVLELRSDLGFSDEDGAYPTTYGPLGVDDLAVIGGGINRFYDFESGMQGWTPAIGAAAGDFATVEDVSCYTILDPGACGIAQNLMEMHAGACPDGDHPNTQHQIIRSPICDVGDGTINQSIFLDMEIYGEMPLENGVFFRPGWEYYPYVCPVTGDVGWSPRVGQQAFTYIGANPDCMRLRFSATSPSPPSTPVPGNAQKVRALVEVVYDCTAFNMSCTGVTNATPLLDNLAVGVVGGAVPLPDLAVIGFSTPDARAVPGDDLLLEFAIQNVGNAPTSNGVLNYIFLWNPESMTEGPLLDPTASHVSHTFQFLQPGDIDHHGLIAVRIPADTPRDTTLTLAVITDYGGGEEEPNESNNMALLMVPCGPRQIALTDDGATLANAIDLPFYDDRLEFQAAPGDVIFAETYAAREGSTLDSRLALLGPERDSLLAGEGSLAEIAPDSRVCGPAVTTPGLYRLGTSGENATVGAYAVELRRGMPEVEPNDDPSVATAFAYGEARIGTIGQPGDVDFWVFQGMAGQVLTLDVDADQMFETAAGEVLDPILLVLDSAADTLLLVDDVNEYDPRLFFPLPATGSYYVTVEDAPGMGLGTGFPNYRYAFRLVESQDVILTELVALDLASSVPQVPPQTPFTLQHRTLNNGGLSTFAGGVSVGVHLSPDPLIDPGDEILAVADFEGDLAPGESHVSVTPLMIPGSVPPGMYYLGVIVDPTHSEVEGDEGNNTASVPLTVLSSEGVEPAVELPARLALLPSRPNPVQGSATVEYWLPAGPDGRSMARPVRVEVVDVTGRAVAVLVNQTQSSGKYVVQWDGRAGDRLAPSGVYFQRMSVDGSVLKRRFILMR